MLEDKISGYLDILTKAATKAGPQVMQFAIQHEHWCGVGDICIGLFFLAIALIGLFLCVRHFQRLHKMEEPGATICVVSGIAGLLALIVSCFQLLNIWNWVAVFNPKIALFHDILTKFLDH